MSDTPHPRIIAGLPAYNEAKYIGTMVLNTRQYVDEVIVVDDGSKDNTARIAELAGAFVVSHHKNRGYGAAIKSILHAAKDKDPDVLVILDADSQHDPREIKRLIAPIQEGFDFVVGSRKEQSNRIPFYRRMGQKVLLHSTNVLATDGLSDSESGFRAFSRNALAKLDLREDGMAISAETVVEASKLGLKVTEVPISVSYGEDSSTLNPLAHGLGVLTRILVMISERKPLFFFGMAGIALIMLGISSGIRVLQLFSASNILPVGTTLVTVIFLIVGSFSIFTGLILRALSRRRD